MYFCSWKIIVKGGRLLCIFLLTECIGKVANYLKFTFATFQEQNFYLLLCFLFLESLLKYGHLYCQVITNLYSILKSRDTTLPTKVRLVKVMVFPVVMYGCES